jgi:hypothetical protein
MDQGMQVTSIGRARGHTAHEFAPVHCEDGFEHRVGAEQKREHRRYDAVAVNQQDAEFTEQETQQMGTAVPEEGQPGWEVPDGETQNSTRHDHRGGEHEGVADLEGHAAERQDHHQYTHRSEAVEAVAGVDGIGRASR